MVRRRVFVGNDRGNAALRVPRVAVEQRFFRNHEHLVRLACLDRRKQAGNARTYHNNVRFDERQPAQIEIHNVSRNHLNHLRVPYVYVQKGEAKSRSDSPLLQPLEAEKRLRRPLWTARFSKGDSSRFNLPLLAASVPEKAALDRRFAAERKFAAASSPGISPAFSNYLPSYSGKQETCSQNGTPYPDCPCAAGSRCRPPCPR